MLVAVVAVILGAGHYHEIRSTAENLKELQNVASTRYLGVFPIFVDAIADLLASAKETIDILCDFPGYGDFSSPAAGLKYRQTLESKRAAGVTVIITCLDETSRTAYLNQEFPAKEWQTWESDRSKKDKVHAFLKSMGVDPASVKTREDLFRAMHEADRQILPKISTKANPDAKGPMPMYCWIVDRKRAVFSISTLATGAIEHGFTTAAPDFVKALEDLIARYRPGTPSA